MLKGLFARRASVLSSAVAPVVEPLEKRFLLAVQPLPVSLDFSSVATGTTADKDGQGTGFAYVQPNKLGNQHQPSLIDLDTAAGVLRITSSGTATSGSSWGSDNTLVNALGTEFDASLGVNTITTRLKGPLSNIDAPHEQGGVWFGPDMDNWVKLVAIATPSGTRVQFVDEQKGPDGIIRHFVETTANPGSFASITALDLRIIANPSTRNVLGSYRVNGGAWVDLSPKLTIGAERASAFFGAGTGRAGLIAMHKNSVGPVTVAFDSFAVSRSGSVTPVGQPEIKSVTPGNGGAGVSRDGFVAADLKLVVAGKGVNKATMNGSTVRLFRTADGEDVPANRNTSGIGDDLVLVPTTLLDANTQYTFQVTSGLRDLAGNPFKPFTSMFTTGTQGGTTNPDIAFQKIDLSAAGTARYTGVEIGPDGKLYASSFGGDIVRWPINPDGTLGARQNVSTVRTSNGGAFRTITGFAFSPGATAANPVMYVSHGQFADNGTTATDFTGKISRLGGANLTEYEDFVVNLPRSISDHMNNQPVFGPDNALYFGQASNTSFGAPDATWGNRPNHLLNAAILRADLNAIRTRLNNGQGPLDARTTDAGGSYNPFAAGAPLTIYASGVRNAYDLLWHSNGKLYAPVNGSNAGGNTPAGGGAPALTNLAYTESDWLFRVAQGKYHGHPNPTRNEFVLNGGNPTSGVDGQEVKQYPSGTQPDPDYNRPIYGFGAKYSPNGLIEYTGDAFGGRLDGAILVARYSAGDDIFVVKVDPTTGNFVSFDAGISGFDRLADPLDLVQGPNGTIYVAEYGGQRITLLKPIPPGAHPEVSHATVHLSDVVNAGNVGPTFDVVLRNTGTTPLSLASNALTITGPDAGMFVLKNKPVGEVPAGGSVTIGVAFNPLTGTDLNSVKTAALNIVTNSGSLTVALRGLPTQGTGGQNEPSLQEIVNLYGYQTDVGDDDDTTTVYPANPVTADQVDLQRMLKAGAGPASIEVLGVMGVASNPALRFGWYYGGSFNDRNHLFTVPTSQAQTVQVIPNGDTSFDPGNASFALYSNWPNFDAGKRIAYSEDRLNTWDAGKRKYRFFKLRDASGAVVQDAYIFAVEEWDQASANAIGQGAFAYDSNDIVGIIRNVKPAVAGPEIGLQNMDAVPFGDRLVFSSLGTKDVDTPNVTHNRAQLRVTNTGSSTLNVTSIAISGGWAWTRAGGAGGAFSLAPGATETITVTFIATSSGVHTGELTINSNDPDEPTKRVQLAGSRQPGSEQAEPTLQQVIDIFGYKTRVLHAGQSFTADAGRREALGDEVLSPFWVRAFGSQPVTVRQLAAYHSVAFDTNANFAYRPKATGTYTLLFEHQQHDSQTLLPRKLNSGSDPAYEEFSPTGAFEIQIDGERSDDAMNTQEKPGGQYGHRVRFYPAKDRTGAPIPNTWLILMDYQGINYDFNDNVYLITNVRPELAPAQPEPVAAYAFSTGTEVRWKPSAEPDVTGYNVYRSTGADGPFTKLSTTAATKFYDDTASPGVTYYYRVGATDTQGYESAWSFVTKRR